MGQSPVWSEHKKECLGNTKKATSYCTMSHKEPMTPGTEPSHPSEFAQSQPWGPHCVLKDVSKVTLLISTVALILKVPAKEKEGKLFAVETCLCKSRSVLIYTMLVFFFSQVITVK